MKKNIFILGSIMLVVGLSSISWDTSHTQIKKDQPLAVNNFKAHWNDGKAEISSYALQQSRYGDLHEGEATMIFVTEPFSKSKQVKLDDYRNDKDKVEVLKLNAVRKFDTGIYPYSTMSSIFSPYETDGRALKVSTSVQEWCGHAFLQVNRKKNKVHISGRSYFESEGDQESTIKNAYMEDELWNFIRINPELLPKGTIQLIPATLFSRLKHHPPQVTKATAQLTKTQNEQFSTEQLFDYTIQYNQPTARTVSIFFDTQFPYQIKGWQEKGRHLTTTATLKKSIRLDYWSKHNNEHRELKKLLD